MEYNSEIYLVISVDLLIQKRNLGRERLKVGTGFLHLFLSFPTFEPSDGMFSCPLENVSSVHTFVVVQKHNVTFRHLDISHILHRNFVHLFQLFVTDESIVTEVHVRFVDLRSSVFKSFSSVTSNRNFHDKSSRMVLEISRRESQP